MRLLIILMLSALSALGDAMPPHLIGYWGTAGVAGGIPEVTNIYTTLSPGVTAAQISAALAAAPSNSVVYLNAGTYYLNSYIRPGVNKKGVVLRGAGKSTLLKFSGGMTYGNIIFEGDYVDIHVNPPTHIVSWTSGYAKGTSNLVVSSTAGMSVGMTVFGDQINNGTDITVLGVENCSNCGRRNPDRSQQQAFLITAINGNTLTVWPPLHMSNWSATYTPEIWWIGDMAVRCGVEDLSLDSTASWPGQGQTYGPTILFFYANNCWVRNIYSTNDFSPYSIESSHVVGLYAANLTVKHSYFYGTKRARDMSYGMLFSHTHNSLVEDNGFEKIPAPITLGQASSGNVIAFNIATNYYNVVGSTYVWPIVLCHDAHNSMNLIEGNIGHQVEADHFHGSSGHNVIFRNKLDGYDGPAYYNYQHAIILEPTNRNWSAVGNVLGHQSWHQGYEQICGYNADTRPIYRLGCTRVPAIYNDPPTGHTLYRHGNWDTIIDDIRWNATNADHTLPDSLYLSAKPAWFGNLPWPAVDPANGAAIAANPDYWTNVPAGYRLIYGTEPPADNTTATPVFSQGTGAYSPLPSVTLTCSTPSSAIYYTLDGSTPDNTDTVYSGAIQTTNGMTIKAIAYASGYNSSSVASATYSLLVSVADPVFSPAVGVFNEITTVTITTATAGAELRYTLDGSIPNASSTLYTEPLTVSTPTTITVVGSRNGFLNSTIVSGLFNVRVAPVVFNPVGGNFTNYVYVAMSSLTTNVTIFYTRDGTTPTALSTPYLAPTHITATTTLKAIAIRNGFGGSAVTTDTFTIYGGVNEVGVNQATNATIGTLNYYR